MVHVTSHLLSHNLLLVPATTTAQYENVEMFPPSHPPSVTTNIAYDTVLPPPSSVNEIKTNSAYGVVLESTARRQRQH